MLHVRFVTLLSVLTLAFWASILSASTITYEVGKCRAGLPKFPTISSALAAVPPANVIDVCPGIYKEQVQITHSVTLEGIPNSTSAQAIIAPPAGGLVTNATDDLGNPLAVQLWVNNASGPVNIKDLTVDASGNEVPIGTTVTGIFYQNSNGTVRRVATRNQAGSGFGIGIFAQGGSSNQVTIENSSIHDYDAVGILADSGDGNLELTAFITGNEVTTLKSSAADGIFMQVGSTANVTSNLVVNAGFVGINADGLGDSISGNTVVNSAIGIEAGADDQGISVTSNRIFASAAGIVVQGVGNQAKPPAIQSNAITNSTIGIDFACFFPVNVHSNIIMDAGTALAHVPSATISNNQYFNVATIRTGGCR